MRTMTALVAGLALVVAMAGCTAKTGVAAAADAMGATNLNSIQFSGTGTNYAYGQAYTPGGPWPRFDVKTYIAAVDYQAPAMRLEMLRAQGEHPPKGGGAQPFAVTLLAIAALTRPCGVSQIWRRRSDSAPRFGAACGPPSLHASLPLTS